MIAKIWERPATIERNNFKYKSLSSFSYNIAIGCNHACTFCYVPQVSTIRMSSKLAEHGVKDPDAEWGDYVFLRKWDKNAFVRSLQEAERTPAKELNADGNRAIMLCTTTDPYQTLRVDHDQTPDEIATNAPVRINVERTKELNAQRRHLVREALELILEFSTLNVRILTRSPLAREDFELFKCFGNRLLFGMSLPTLDNQLAKIYEPKAPAPSQRLATLQAAKTAGLNVYVAVAPVYPDCVSNDMLATLRAVKKLDPVTVFMEPINIRADNVARIEARCRELGVEPRTKVFQSPEQWRYYAVGQMHDFSNSASQVGLADRLHLWPDGSLGSKTALAQLGSTKGEWSASFLGEPVDQWLHKHWHQISAWPK